MTAIPDRTRTTSICTALAVSALAAATVAGSAAGRLTGIAALPPPRSIGDMFDWWSSQPVLSRLGDLGAFAVALALGAVTIVLLDTARLASVAAFRTATGHRHRPDLGHALDLGHAPSRGLRSSRAIVALLTATAGTVSVAVPSVGAATDSGTSAATAIDSATTPTADLIAPDGGTTDGASDSATRQPTGTATVDPSTGSSAAPATPSDASPTSPSAAVGSRTPAPTDDPATHQFGTSGMPADTWAAAAAPSTRMMPPGPPSTAPTWLRPPRSASPERSAAPDEGAPRLDLEGASTSSTTRVDTGQVDTGRVHTERVDTERVVEEGDNLWSISADEVGRTLGRVPLDREVADYWHGLIETNRGRLPDPNDPDLIVPGMRLVVPPVGAPTSTSAITPDPSQRTAPIGLPSP